MIVPYIELGASSAFSFFQSCLQPEDLARQAAQLGYPYCGITDLNGIYGAPRFNLACKSQGIEGLVGARLNVSNLGALRVFCEDAQGYKNLCRILSIQHKSNLTLSSIIEHQKGLIFICRIHPESSFDLLKSFLRQTSQRNFFLEMQRHFDRQENILNKKALDAAHALSLPIIATNDVRCLNEQDKFTLDTLTCISQHSSYRVVGRQIKPNGEWFLKSPKSMAKLFQDLPQATRHTLEIAERASFRLEQIDYRLPHYDAPQGYSQEEWLRELSYRGAKERYRKFTRKVKAQLEHELKIICDMNLAGYFLIVWDITRFAREQGFLCQGRGSAANSVVCYALRITALEPISMNLLFERFLSPEREECPDIDLDFPSGKKREQVIQYVYNKYGRHHAALVANVITYKRRSALRDVGKVLELPETDINHVVKLSQTPNTESELSFAEQIRRLRPNIQPEVAHAWGSLSQSIFGLPRHLGQHPGGIVIAKNPLDEIVPTQPAAMPLRTIIQWDKEDCANLDLIKIDLLGLGMLEALEGAKELIHKHHHIDLDYGQLPMDDPKTYRLLSQADTVGVFQVESRAQMNILPRLKPKTFYDIVVSIALIRPGPITGNMVHPYLKRREGSQEVRYPHPSLEPILKRTLGVPIFQEQIMRMAMTAANFSGGEADKLRRAMGFRHMNIPMQEIRTKLFTGMRANNIPPAAQEEIARQISAFASYGFPESHSASFALLSYASAYLKAHYPAIFYTALLNSWPMGFYQPDTLIKDGQRHSVRFKPIDIMHSQWFCHLEGERCVRLGLRHVHGLHKKSGQKLISERSKPYKNIAQLLKRSGLQNAEISTLAEIGAFRETYKSRRQALWQLSAFRERHFGLLAQVQSESPVHPLNEMSFPEEIAAEVQQSGMSASPHPLSLIRVQLHRRGFLSAKELNHCPDGAPVRVAGQCIVKQRPSSAKGFVFLTLEDEFGFLNIIIKPDLFNAKRDLILSASLFDIKGILQNQKGTVQIRGTSIQHLRQNTLV